MKYVYIHGSYYGNNYGDVLLVDLFAKKIKEFGFEPVFPFANEFYKEQTGVEIGLKHSVFCGIFCGGGYLGEPSTKKLRWSFRNYYRHSKAYKLMIGNQLRYGVFGVGFGPLTFNPFKAVAIDILKNADKVMVRDKKSADYFLQYSNRRDTEIAADVVISLEKSDIPSAAKESVEEKWGRIFSNKSIIGIHVTNKFKDESTFQYIKSAIKELANKNPDTHFVFIADGKSRLNRKLQQTIDAEDIASNLNENQYSFYAYENHWEMTYLLSKLSLVITSKLHVGIVSTAMKVSVVSLPYHSKTIRYYKQVNAEERCLENPKSSEEVYNHIDKFIGSEAIKVPDEVMKSSNNVFSSLQSFLIREE